MRDAMQKKKKQVKITVRLLQGDICLNISYAMRIGQKYVNDYIYSDYSKELNIRDKQTVKNLQPNVEFSQVF